MDFSVRFRGNTTYRVRLHLRSASISIHAPARGATSTGLPMYQKSDFISIHAPARGATGSETAGNTISIFQSTLPQGERQSSSSICLTYSLFQSTLPRGERPVAFCAHLTTSKFQSTLPRGERPHSPSCWLSLEDYFNPRSREGSDLPSWTHWYSHC